jgi:hypothetical protein
LELRRSLRLIQRLNHLLLITLKLSLCLLYFFRDFQLSSNNYVQILNRHALLDDVAAPFVVQNHFTRFNQRFDFFVCQFMKARDRLQKIDRLCDAA